MTPLSDLLDQYSRLARDTREKGFLLEKLTQSYLSIDPLWTAHFKQVWLWQDWPGRNGKVDTGIDLVAEDMYGRGFCAIQCKFFNPSHTIQKSDIDSFFTASGKHPFTSRIVVSTTDKWSKHAEDALVDQQIKTWRIGLDDLAQSLIDWSDYSLTEPSSLPVAEKKQVRAHQAEAVADVVAGFDEASRGQMIMACGTGKTFTSLRIAEAIAGLGGSVLFMVPSIA